MQGLSATRFSGFNRQSFLDATWLRDADNTWSNYGAWDKQKVPNKAGDIARLAGAISTGRVVTLDIPITLGQLIVSAVQTYTISGTKTITFINGGNAGILTQSNTGGSPPTWTFNIAIPNGLTFSTTPALTLSGIISGAGSITKTGAGAATLSGVNTFTGKTIINAGTIVINADSGLGTAPGSPVVDQITIGSTGILNITTNTTLDPNRGITLGSGICGIQITSSTTTTYNGIIAGVGPLQKSNGGVFNVGGVNTYTGGTTIAGGNFAAIADSGFGAVPGSPIANHISFGGGNLTCTTSFTLHANRGITQVSAANSQFQVNSGQTMIYNGIITGIGGSAITKISAGTLQLGGANTFTGGVTITTGVINAQVAAALGVTGAVTVASGAALQLQGGITYNTLPLTIVAGGISSDGALRSISGVNVWPGAITVQANANSRIVCDAGTLTISGNIALSATTSDNLAIYGNGDVTVSGIISGASKVSKFAAAGITTFSGANTWTGTYSCSSSTTSVATFNSVSGGVASSSLGAPTTIANGTIAIGSTSNPAIIVCTGTGETTDRVLNLAGTTGGATITMSGASGLLKFTSALTATGSGAKTLTLNGSTSGTGELAGAVVDSGGGATAITKSGTGTWTLSGTNSATGALTVSAGILLVTGSTNATMAATVNGGRLAGTGTVNGTVSVSNTANSILQGGTGAGNTGTLTTGALTFSGSTASVTVNTNGTTTIGLITSTGAVTLGSVTVNFNGALLAGTYTIIGGSSMSGVATQGTVATGRTWTSLTVVGNNLVAVLA